ncbi:MAG: patatin-like phospholipase family protein [archaeon]
MKKRYKKHKRPTIGLALSGGSVRGLCYIGFLKVLDEEKIPVDYIAGTSIGSVIGALYCSGMHPSEMEKIVSDLNWETFMDFTAKYTGLLDGKKIERFLRKNLKVKDFKDLYIPFSAVAVDVNSGEKIIFDKGDIVQAVRASISIPGVFTPVKIGNRLLVDGGILDPIPIDALAGKVDKVIAIDLTLPYEPFRRVKAVDTDNTIWKKFKNRFIIQEVSNIKSYLKNKKAIPGIFLKVLNPKFVFKFLSGKAFSLPPMVETVIKANHLTSNEFTRLKLEMHKPDLLIKPHIDGARFIEFDKAPLLIKIGEDAARKNIVAIRKLAKV